MAKRIYDPSLYLDGGSEAWRLGASLSKEEDGICNYTRVARAKRWRYQQVQANASHDDDDTDRKHDGRHLLETQHANMTEQSHVRSRLSILLMFAI